MTKNEFGKLVRLYRKQRGWTQEELAEHWGYTRSYVTLVESGKKPIDRLSQINRLADILDIPKDRLEAIGKGVVEKESTNLTTPSQADDAILQMLLAPGRDMVRLSYVVWLADQHPIIEENLHDIVSNIDQALTAYHGTLVKPAQQVLAYAHQMMGRMAFDRLDFAAASGHFSEMIDLGQELNDPDIITLGMSYQGDVLRKRGRYETALRCFEAAKIYVPSASKNIQGKHLAIVARAHYLFGDEEGFRRSIDSALDIASDMKNSISDLANQFSLDEVLCEQAGGYTRLGQPDKAIEIYAETDKLRPFRPLRELGSYTLEKSLAHLYTGDLDTGIDFSLKGLQLATEYKSKRHVRRMDITYNRLKVMPFKDDKRLDILHEAILKAQGKQENW